MAFVSETLQLSGIRCERCVLRLGKVLEGHDGLELANANLMGEVLVRYDDGHVELTVSDDGTGDGGGESGGHGLVGMRERISVYGGELEAGPLPEGGYRLHARLPTA